MNKRNRLIYLLFLLTLLLAACTTMSAGTGSKDAYRISVAQLKDMLGSPDLIVIDVRDPVSWAKSDTKIVGAVREDPQNFDAWAGKYSKNKTIVFYCA